MDRDKLLTELYYINIKKIERTVWDRAREICMDLADENAADVN